MRGGIDLAEHYASADLFLFPSLSETFGNVTLDKAGSYRLVATAAGLAVMTVPALADIISGRVRVSALRHIELDDLLGRDPVQLDMQALRRSYSGKTILVTGAAGMFVGAQGVPPLDLFVVAMLGLALACGGASALNHVLDRDIDKLMGSRTEKRPVATGRVSPEQALEFGIVLSALSFALLASAVNVLTAVLALVGNLFYVLVYTRWLKRSTPQNIVIGGAAGAVPPLVGYAAATGSLALPALWLFLIVFLWTPPHFWALALMIKNAYAAAGVPMLPVVRGDRETARQIVLYSLAMVAFTVVVGIWLGPLYTVSAVVLGAVFVGLALLLRRDLSRARAQVLFHYSLLYLALLFTAAALDPVLL